MHLPQVSELCSCGEAESSRTLPMRDPSEASSSSSKNGGVLAAAFAIYDINRAYDNRLVTTLARHRRLHALSKRWGHYWGHRQNTKI